MPVSLLHHELFAVIFTFITSNILSRSVFFTSYLFAYLPNIWNTEIRSIRIWIFISMLLLAGLVDITYTKLSKICINNIKVIRSLCSQQQALKQNAVIRHYYFITKVYWIISQLITLPNELLFEKLLCLDIFYVDLFMDII